MATHTVTPTTRVLILGHSFIRRLQKFMEHHIGYLDLFLQITATADITWHGIGRRTVAKTIKFNLHVVRSTRPDIAIVQLGTNDLPFVRRDFPCILYLIRVSYLAFKYSL